MFWWNETGASRRPFFCQQFGNRGDRIALLSGDMTTAPSESATFAELRRADLFANATDDQLRLLSGSMHIQHFEPGHLLFRHGEAATRFFFLRRGQIKLFRVSPDGDEKIIEIVQPGQTFAEAVTFLGSGESYPVSAETLVACEVFAFDQHTFLRILRESQEIAFGMLASMGRRLHMLVNQIDSLTLQNATYRLVMYLLDHAPSEDRPGTDIELTTPKSAIASRLAIQPETLSRLLGKLRDQGLIEVHGPHIILRDVRGLRSLVQLGDSPEMQLKPEIGARRLK